MWCNHSWYCWEARFAYSSIGYWQRMRRESFTLGMEPRSENGCNENSDGFGSCHLWAYVQGDRAPFDLYRRAGGDNWVLTGIWSTWLALAAVLDAVLVWVYVRPKRRPLRRHSYVDTLDTWIPLWNWYLLTRRLRFVQHQKVILARGEEGGEREGKEI